MTERDRFDPWRVLGVRRGASREEVARAYRALAKRHHPDLHGVDAARRMRDLNRAFAMLADPAHAEDMRDEPLTRPHWSGAIRSSPSEPGPGPATWAAWEAGTARASSETRVRSARGWPRTEAAEPAQPIVRDSPLAAVLVALGIVVAVIGLGWVASTSQVASSARQAFGQLGVTPASTVQLDTEHSLAVYRQPDGRLGLAAARLTEVGWQGSVLAVVATTDPYSVLLVDVGDAGLGSWQTVVFGRSRPGVDHVELSGVDGRGGDVANGTWAIAAPIPLTADALEWRFVGPDDNVLLTGTGELSGD